MNKIVGISSTLGMLISLTLSGNAAAESTGAVAESKPQAVLSAYKPARNTVCLWVSALAIHCLSRFVPMKSVSKTKKVRQ